MNINDWIGTIGVSVTLIAYFLNMTSLIPNNGKLFYLLNVFGAGIACFASFRINYVPFIILEGTWTLISAVGYFNCIKKTST